MAGIIKKQILKHLSKFAKNLSADSIQLSTLKGEGELSNLELDCVAIQNLLDLPTWLQINHANCNRVHVKIPWTKLKVSPIILFLDCVNMDMITCERPRAQNGPSPIEASASNGESSYGFIEKVLEGITVRINSINVNFKSEVFTAEFQLSQLLVYSTDPEWRKADLRFSRLVNTAVGQVLTFKKITWQTMRIVSDAASRRTGGMTTPIRLITNQATVEIVLRRKISDLSVLASKLHVKFDDLLWVLTDAQVHSALLCVNSIKETIERSKQQRRKQHPSTNKQNPSPPPTPNQSDATNPGSDPYFVRHVIHETSYHCDVDRIDFHICDDGSSANSEATYKKVVEGGAILITLYNLKMDHYPSHCAGKPRNHFRGYNDIATSRDKWADAIIKKFRKDFVELKKAAEARQPPDPSFKSGSKLVESCLIFTLGDIDVSQVTSPNDKERSDHKVISSNRKELFLPPDMPLASVFITDYYYPDGRDYPAPHSNIFVRVNALYLRAHWPSLLWINQLSLSTMQTVQRMLKDLGVILKEKDPTQEDHTDIRIEALMPKVFIPLLDPSSDHDTIEGIQIQISQLAVTNSRHGEESSRKDLLQLIKDFKESYINNNSCFPSEHGHDFDFLHQRFEEHANAGDSPIAHALSQSHPQLRRSSLISKACSDIWCIWLRQIWFDFVVKSDKNSPESKPKTHPFLDSVPLTIWICKIRRSTPPGPLSPPRSSTSLPSVASMTEHDLRKTISAPKIASPDREEVPNDEQCERSGRNKSLLDFYRKSVETTGAPPPKPLKEVQGPASLYVIIRSEKPISLILDHHQFLFLLRLVDSVGSVGEKVVDDTSTILSDPAEKSGSDPPASEEESNGLRIFLPTVNLNLILRPITALTSNPSLSSSDKSPGEMASNEEGAPPHPQRPLTPTSMKSRSSDDCSVDAISLFGDDSTLLLPTMLSALTLDKRASTTSSRRGSNPSPAGQLRKKAGKKMASKFVTSGQQNSYDSEYVGSDVTSSGYYTGSNRASSPCEDTVSCASSGNSSLEQFEVLELDGLSGQNESTQQWKGGRNPSTFPTIEARLELARPGPVTPPAMTCPDTLISPPSIKEEDLPPASSVEQLKPKLVSVLCISTCGATELAVDSHDDGSSIRVVAPKLALKQFGDTSLDDAINTILQGTPLTSKSPHYSIPCLRMRIDSGRCASRFFPRADKHMNIQIHHFHDKISSSTLTNLGAFFEDDVPPEVVPMKIDAFDVNLSIEDDLDTAYPTTFRSPPVLLNIHEAHVKRDMTGTFHVSTESKAAPDLLTSLHFSANQEQAPSNPCNRVNDVSDVRNASTVDKEAVDAAEVASLRHRLEEMTQERDAFVKTLSHLQEELDKSERERNHLQSLVSNN